MMSRYTLTHLPDQILLHELKTLVAQDRQTTALLIAHLGEVDARRLYAPAGDPSMYEWCVREPHFSENIAYKRIQVARAARQFPAVCGMSADGRLHLTAVVFLAPHLSACSTRGPCSVMPCLPVIRPRSSPGRSRR
jgi:hypothetical protein